MHKTDLIDAVASRANISKKDASAAVNALLDVITDTLSKGESVTLPGFGTFERRQRQARTGVHPQTKAPLTIAASTVAGFTAGSKLREAVRGQAAE